MGSGCSNLWSRTSRHRVKPSRRTFASFFCGGSSSHAPLEMDDYTGAELRTTIDHCLVPIDTFSHTETLFTNSNTESGSSSVSRNSAGRDATFDEQSTANELSVSHNPKESYTEENSVSTSSSIIERQLLGSSANVSSHMGSSQISYGTTQESNQSSNRDHMSSFDSLLVVHDTPLVLESLGDESHESNHVDMTSSSSTISSSSNAEISNREAQRNGRRLFWDAFSRRSSRRSDDSPSVVITNDQTDEIGSRGRWLLDFGSDFFGNGAGSGDSGYTGNRIHSMNERRRSSRSEIWDRLHSGIDDSTQQTTFCPSGIHPVGTSCSCDSFLMNEDAHARASISRIVMLAEALFEVVTILQVLDEIHRQPLSLSLSMVSLPAPGSVVDSFPVKKHKMPDPDDCVDDAQECYICLAEYEEGDNIRVLPCRHEYHMSCVDKWLKEIHRVCPLCRGDVCEGVSKCSVSNSNS